MTRLFFVIFVLVQTQQFFQNVVAFTTAAKLGVDGLSKFSNNIQRTMTPSPCILRRTTNLCLLNKKRTTSPPIVVEGVGEEGCALPSTSGINTLPEPTQAAVVLAIYVGLGVGTVALSSFLDYITNQYEWVQAWRYSWPLLGVIYAIAGVTHFTISEEYENIFPSRNAWGIWGIPGNAEFHVKWTGLVEVIAGLGLLVGGAFDALAPVWYTSPNLFTAAGLDSDSAVALLLLSICVTPANIYMYTHGARLPRDGPDVPIAGHFVRGIFQIILFSILYQMGQETFEALLTYDVKLGIGLG